jgi:hypothetical protein
VPQLSRHELLPGAQGIRTLTRAEQGDPRLAWRAARQQQEGEGFVYLDPTAEIDPRFRPEGVAASTYCYAIPCIDRQRRPGVRFTELWEVPIPTPPGMSQVFRFDHDLANAWRASLVADGLVPQPNPLIMEREIRRARQRLARAQAASPSAARDVKVAAVEAEVEPEAPRRLTGGVMSDNETRTREAIARTARDLARSTGMSQSDAERRVAEARRRNERRSRDN